MRTSHTPSITEASKTINQMGCNSAATCDHLARVPTAAAAMAPKMAYPNERPAMDHAESPEGNSAAQGVAHIAAQWGMPAKPIRKADMSKPVSMTPPSPITGEAHQMIREKRSTTLSA